MLQVKYHMKSIIYKGLFLNTNDFSSYSQFVLSLVWHFSIIYYENRVSVRETHGALHSLHIRRHVVQCASKKLFLLWSAVLRRTKMSPSTRSLNIVKFRKCDRFQSSFSPEIFFSKNEFRVQKIHYSSHYWDIVTSAKSHCLMYFMI